MNTANQQVLIGVIFALVLVISFLVYDRAHRPETLGEKVGATIDRAADHMERAADRAANQ